jgi:hypothetical protein
LSDILTMRTRPLLAVAFFAALTAAGSLFAAEQSDWSAGFQNPPLSAHPQVWWHWMNGNVTRVGITADLEAMHRIGIQEANIITVASDIPPGPVPVMSRQFFDMVEFAAQEAQRLGMTLCIDNCPGWSSSGGPWITPALSMQFITTSETKAAGPSTFSAVLPPPPTKLDYYQDIAVLAFKTPAGEDAPPLRMLSPIITSSVPALDASALIDGNPKTAITLPTPLKGPPQFLQLTFPQPLTARTLIITAGTMRAAGGTIDISDDGVTFRALEPFGIPRNPTAPVYISLGDKTVTARAFRFNFTHASAGSESIVLDELDLSPRLFIPAIGTKALYEANAIEPKQVEHDSRIIATPDAVISQEGIVNLTSSLKPDGSLSWQVPPGNWAILRVGHTTTGKTNHPAPPEATGLECDKFSRAGLDASWNGMMQPLLDRLGPLAGKVVDHCLIDSYEVGGQNWTPLMAAEFQKRRGYDLTPFLPVFTGRVVDSPEQTERFLWDFRRTVSDLFADNYFDYFTELCHKHGLRSMIEPYTGPFESLRAGATNDIPMGEFWAGSNGHPSIKLASSVGHIYGQAIIAAESLTGNPSHGMWTDDPFSLKATGDIGFCSGINRFVFHRFAHQPWMNRFPGMTMGQWGINLDRTNTWFDLAGPWITYITRSQYLLQQGKPANDIAYFCGESAPVLTRAGKDPAGYADDSINTDVLLHQASVKDHRLVLADGVSYAILVLPESDPEMTPELLRKLHGFVEEGLTILGPRPEHSPSLTNYPQCDAEVKALAAELWGDVDGKSVKEHAFGQGKVIWGERLENALASLHVGPDFACDGESGNSHFNFIHRTGEEGDIYFVANHDQATIHLLCMFRVSGKIPELWHADTGVMETAPAYTAHDGVTTIPLAFDPSGSVFVLFRKTEDKRNHLVAAEEPADVYELHVTADADTQLLAWKAGNYQFHTTAGKTVEADASTLPAPVRIEGPWQIHFPPHWEAPDNVTFDHLMSWTDSSDKGVKYFSGAARYTKRIDIPQNLLGENQRLYLALGEVKNLAQVSLNGKDLGILWKPPFRVDITSAAKAGANDLEIRITNLWPNRMIGDAQLPEDVEWSGMKLSHWPQWLLDGKDSPTGRLTFTTWHHITKSMPLLPSGLLGPVQLQPAETIPVR